MITENEIIKDLKDLMSKIEHMSITYKNNDIWKQINKELDSIVTKIQKDRQIYGY